MTYPTSVLDTIFHQIVFFINDAHTFLSFAAEQLLPKN